MPAFFTTLFGIVGRNRGVQGLITMNAVRDGFFTCLLHEKVFNLGTKGSFLTPKYRLEMMFAVVFWRRSGRCFLVKHNNPAGCVSHCNETA